MVELTEADTCLDIVQLRQKSFRDPAALFRHMKPCRDLVRQYASLLFPNINIISYFFKQSAFRFGDFYEHMMLEPMRDSIADKVASPDPHNEIKDWLFDHSFGKPAKYAFKVQLVTSPEHHPTEDASIV